MFNKPPAHPVLGLAASAFGVVIGVLMFALLQGDETPGLRLPLIALVVLLSSLVAGAWCVIWLFKGRARSN